MAKAEPRQPAWSNPGPCPCGSGKTYAACCGPVHGGALAADAEALMRSRYSAFVLGLEAYLLATWHPSTRPPHLDLHADPCGKWLGLQVKRHTRGDPDHAVVEFVARHRSSSGRAERMHEISSFVREDGRWYYVAAEHEAEQSAGK